MSITISSLLLLALVHPLPADDPDPPALGKKSMECQVPVESPAADHLVLRCVTRAKLPAVTVLLHYRQSGSEDFTVAPTLRSRNASVVCSGTCVRFASGVAVSIARGRSLE